MTDDELIKMLRALGARQQAEPIPEPDSARLKAEIAAAIGAGEGTAPSEPDVGVLTGWVKALLIRLTDTPEDRYRSVANEIYVQARQEPGFRAVAHHELLLAIARAVLQVHEEIARSAAPAAGPAAPSAPPAGGQAEVETLTTLTGVRKHSHMSREQLDRLAALREKDPPAWEAYILYHLAGRSHAELDRWCPIEAGRDVFKRLADAKKAVVSPAR